MTHTKGLALLLAFALTGFASNQALSRQDVFNNIGNGFAWAGAAPSWGSDHTIVTKADFVAQVKNNGNCVPSQPNSYVMAYSDMQACAISSSAHSPILANNTFANGSFLNWTDDATSGCTSGAVTFGGVNAADQDGDNGFVQGSSGPCASATIGINQSFNVGATPTAQSVSLQYLAPQVTVGGSACGQGFGEVSSLTVKINGSTVTVLASPIADGTWHSLSASTTAMVNGSNTIDISVTLGQASGGNSVYDPRVGDYLCKTANAPQPFDIDAVVLTGTY